MKVYIRNGIALLPTSESRDLAQESIIKDIQNNFDLYTYVLNSYWGKPIKFYQMEIEYADLLYLIPDIQKQIIYNDLSEQHSREMADLCFASLDKYHNLNLNDVSHVLEDCDIYYEMIEMEDDVSDNCIELLLRLR